jgi:hypothetical protein
VVDSAAYRRERDNLLARIVAALEADPSIVAVWLAGSIGGGRSDDLSDLDLWIVVEDDRIQEIAEDPVAFVHGIAPTIIEIHAPSNAPAGGAYLLTWIDSASGPQQVDWYWQPLTGTLRPAQSRLLLERHPVPPAPDRVPLPPRELDHALDAAMRDSLLMAFIAAKHARRGNQWTTAGHLVQLASSLGRVEWLLAHGLAPSFDDRARVPLPRDIPTTPDAQLAWIDAALHRLKTLLAAQHPSALANRSEAFRSVERWLGR